MLVTGVQQSKSVIPIPVYTLIEIISPLGLLQTIELSSLCYTVGPCWLAILNVYVCSVTSVMTQWAGAYQTPLSMGWEALFIFIFSVLFIDLFTVLWWFCHTLT